jgi:hypothetical protein
MISIAEGKMKEYIGACIFCGKDIFCLDGFLNGVLTSDKKLLCFDCDKKDKRMKDPQR